MTSIDQLDYFITPHIRLELERLYLEPINLRASLENAMLDPEFLRDPQTSVPFFSDHGVVHARDTAGQVLKVLATVHGLLIPRRSPDRLGFMRGLGVALAYLHDTGMVDFSRFGRAMHAEWVTQAVFSPEFDDIARAMWDENSGNMAWRLTRLAGRDPLCRPGPLILRELLALASCHSKTKVPAGLLADPARLRQAMQEQLGTDLQVQHARQRAAGAQRRLHAAEQDGEPANVDACRQALKEAEAECDRVFADASGRAAVLAANLSRFYDDFERDAFAWLISGDKATAELVADAIDTLRVLRCADALRQRGTALKTSGGYEIFISRQTGHAAYALRLGTERLYLLEMPNRISAGEANMAASELTEDGDLLIAFQRGSFATPDALRVAVHNAAFVVNDIQADVIDSFQRPADLDDDLKPAEDIAILLEAVEDNPEFTALVLEELVRLNPGAAASARSVPSWQSMTEHELRRYQEAGALDWDMARQSETLSQIGAHGHKVAGMDPARAFNAVRLIHLHPGEILVRAGDPAGFVYVPLGRGLVINPLGGYASFDADPWIPLGVTGIIRGAARNATIAAQANVTLLMIPREVYLSEWHRSYTSQELRSLLGRSSAP